MLKLHNVVKKRKTWKNISECSNIILPQDGDRVNCFNLDGIQQK